MDNVSFVFARSVRILWITIIALSGYSQTALACSIGRNTRPIEVQRDEDARASYLSAEALLEVVALRGSRFDRPGLVRVVRTLKGQVRPGTLLKLAALEEEMCGVGNFRRGSRGLILILERLDRPLAFRGYLPSDYLHRLHRLGLRSLNAPPIQD